MTCPLYFQPKGFRWKLWGRNRWAPLSLFFGLRRFPAAGKTAGSKPQSAWGRFSIAPPNTISASRLTTETELKSRLGNSAQFSRLEGPSMRSWRSRLAPSDKLRARELPILTSQLEFRRLWLSLSGRGDNLQRVSRSV